MTTLATRRTGPVRPPSKKAAVGKIGESSLCTDASWDEYVELLEMFCVANKMTTDEWKSAVLWSCCGEAAYVLI
ncbi:hypothetical protein MTO96_011302 [Rhipicephalus appendiculatus]